MEIARYLKKSKVALDTIVFNAWEKGQISTHEALERFKYNNDIKEDIKPDEFEQWLLGLGYTGV